MLVECSVYLGFVDGVNCHKQNLASITWVIYSPHGQLVSLGGVFIGPSTNNVAKYIVIIEILSDAISHVVRFLEVLLDSQLVVCQLNGSYCVRDPTLLRRFLWVQLSKRHFDFITYNHIPIISNYVSYVYDNYVLDWHLSHN
jgi:ribonuclease HI